MNTRMLPGFVLGCVTATAALSFSVLAQTGAPLPATPASPTPARTAQVIVPAPGALDRNSTQAAEQAVSPASDPAQRTPAPKRIALSYWVREMVKLARAGIDESVQYSFIDNAAGTFNLGAEQIIYLRDAGISSEVISAMLQHDFAIAEGLRSIPVNVTPASDFMLEFIPARTVPAALATPEPRPAVPAPVTRSEEADRVDTPLEDWLAVENLELTLSEADQFQNASLRERQTSYSIREPHPVRISPPIIIIRAPVVQPNLQVLETDY